MSATRSTLAKGVKRESIREKVGALALRSIPSKTGNRTTRAVAVQSLTPLMETVLPMRNLTRRGVTAAARMVDAAVRRTDRATSAPAMRDTRLDAVPPGEHPTRTRPRKSGGPEVGWEGRRRVRPRKKAVSGMMMYWHKTPVGTEEKFWVSTLVKSFFSSVIPVPIITDASMREMSSPLFTHLSVDGLHRARIADESTKNGKHEVSFDRILSILLVVILVSSSSLPSLPLSICFIITSRVSIISSSEERAAFPFRPLSLLPLPSSLDNDIRLLLLGKPISGPWCKVLLPLYDNDTW